MPKAGMGVSPFSLVHGAELAIPMEIGMELARVGVYNEFNTDWHLLELDLVEEDRD